MDSTYVQAPEELYDLGPHSKIAWSLLLRKKKVTETWLVPQLEWISQGQNGVFKNINYYLKWKCFRYAL